MVPGVFLLSLVNGSIVFFSKLLDAEPPFQEILCTIGTHNP
jgi:hypothetical protein